MQTLKVMADESENKHKHERGVEKYSNVRKLVCAVV
jgi:hypothetical protein